MLIFIGQNDGFCTTIPRKFANNNKIKLKFKV